MKKIYLSILSIFIIALSFYSCSKVSENTVNPDKNILRKTGSYSAVSSYTVTWDDNSIAKFYAHSTISDNYQIEIYDDLGTLEQTIIGAIEDDAGTEYSRLKNTSGVVLYEHTYNDPNTNHVNGYPGDCNKLGSRKQNESYEDCYERNYDNFCCDFIGCLAQDTQPILVSLAIAITCSFKDGKPSHMHDDINDEEIYHD